jgi:hypothetical protein
VRLIKRDEREKRLISVPIQSSTIVHVLVVKITMLGGKIAQDFPFSIVELESIIFHGCVK